MRTTVRERYRAALVEARETLHALLKRLEQDGNLIHAQRGLIAWQEDTAAAVALYGGPDDATRFLGRYDFDPVGLSGEYFVQGISTYDDLLGSVIQRVPTLDINRGYDDEVRQPLEKIDELLDRIRDLYTRSTTTGELNQQTASDGLRRWKDSAYKVLTDIVGEEEAAEIYDAASDNIHIEERFVGGITYLVDLKDEIQKYPHHVVAPALKQQPATKSAAAANRNIFVVHGHGFLKDAVARVVTALGLQPVILQEQPGAGRTLIEKFEKYSDVGYAIVLLSPDDIGGKKGEQQHDRARQNVIFELGYFVGKIGRGHVCLLHHGDVEIPSDYFGVEYVPFDEKSAWKYRLGQELKEAGYKIDLNAL